jgi:chromosome segregation ATPase
MWDFLRALWGAVSPHVERHGPAIAGAVVDRFASKALSTSNRKKSQPDERFGRIESGVRHLTEEADDLGKQLEVVHNQLSSQLANLDEKVLRLQDQNREAGNQITLLGTRLDAMEQRLKTWE